MHPGSLKPKLSWRREAYRAYAQYWTAERRLAHLMRALRERMGSTSKFVDVVLCRRLGKLEIVASTMATHARQEPLQRRYSFDMAGLEGDMAACLEHFQSEEAWSVAARACGLSMRLIWTDLDTGQQCVRFGVDWTWTGYPQKV